MAAELIRHRIRRSPLVRVLGDLGAAALLLAMPAFALAVEIKVLSAGALTQPLTELILQFERATSNKVTIVYGTAGAVRGMLEKGDIDAAGYVDRILRGANPAELPIARPTEFVFTVSRSRLDQLALPLRC